MQQDKALRILAEHRQSLSDKYGVKRIGVFPYEESNSASCKCECGNCCGYHPQVGVAVEYMPEVKVGLFEFAGLQIHIQDLFGCDVSLLDINGQRDRTFWRDDAALEEIVYAS